MSQFPRPRFIRAKILGHEFGQSSGVTKAARDERDETPPMQVNRGNPAQSASLAIVRALQGHVSRNRSAVSVAPDVCPPEVGGEDDPVAGCRHIEAPPCRLSSSTQSAPRLKGLERLQSDAARYTSRFGSGRENGAMRCWSPGLWAIESVVRPSRDLAP